MYAFVSYQSKSNPSDNFELLHYDIWGTYRTPSNCAHYFLSIIDYVSRPVWVYLMLDKSEPSMLFQNFVMFVKNQFGKNAKVIRSDNGKEFTSPPTRQFYCDKTTIHQTSCMGTPQQNGKFE